WVGTRSLVGTDRIAPGRPGGVIRDRRPVDGTGAESPTDEAERVVGFIRMKADAQPVFDFPSLTKIIATLGPSTDEPGMLERIIAAGVNVVRLNFSHGTLEEHKKRLDMARAASRKLSLPIAVLGDL